MSDDDLSEPIDIVSWIAKARHNAVVHRQRQVTHILLHAIGITSGLKDALYLKGGVLMALAYQSPRTTGDVDFTTSLLPERLDENTLRVELDRGLQRATAGLGYPDLVCQVQRITPRPRRESFVAAEAPAYSVTIASARRGTNDERQLKSGQGNTVLELDINFREPIGATQRLIFREGGSVRAYALTDLVAEKLRALLQQPIRNRSRRQDVYDIARLLEMFPLDKDEGEEVLRALRIKCAARGITPARESLADPDIKARAGREWHTLRVELEQPLPDFDVSFAAVLAFYEGLPWS